MTVDRDKVLRFYCVFDKSIATLHGEFHRNYLISQSGQIFYEFKTDIWDNFMLFELWKVLKKNLENMQSSHFILKMKKKFLILDGM